MCRIYLSIILCLTAIQQINSQAKLHVEVLYESLCPDSLNFITQQLHPVFKELAPYIDLKLVPFGKSASLQNDEFVCQHGPQECKGNRIQSCVLEAIPDQTVQVDYVNCFMVKYKIGQKSGELGQSCAEGVGVNFNDVSSCYSSTHGTDLQLRAEKATARISPKFVPTILYNGSFNQQLQDASLVDFRRVVCALIAQTYPDVCQRAPIVRL